MVVVEFAFIRTSTYFQDQLVCSQGFRSLASSGLVGMGDSFLGVEDVPYFERAHVQSDVDHGGSRRLHHQMMVMVAVTTMMCVVVMMVMVMMVDISSS